MLERPANSGNAHMADIAPPRDFQEHLAVLEARGLLTRIDRPINKDTELHPLVRWQFQGGLAEEERRAFLFTHVVDGAGHRYDMPVAVGALAASAQIYAVGMGRQVEEIGPAWTDAIAHPIPPVLVTSPPCQEVVITGDALRGPGQGLARLPVPVSTPGFDSAPYLTATLCVTHDPETGVRNMGTYRAQLKATDRLGVRAAAQPWRPPRTSLAGDPCSRWGTCCYAQSSFATALSASGRRQVRLPPHKLHNARCACAT